MLMQIKQVYTDLVKHDIWIKYVEGQGGIWGLAFKRARSLSRLVELLMTKEYLDDQQVFQGDIWPPQNDL